MILRLINVPKGSDLTDWPSAEADLSRLSLVSSLPNLTPNEEYSLVLSLGHLLTLKTTDKIAIQSLAVDLLGRLPQLLPHNLTAGVEGVNGIFRYLQKQNPATATTRGNILFLSKLFRALQALLSHVKARHGMNTHSFVAALQPFFIFGATPRCNLVKHNKYSPTKQLTSMDSDSELSDGERCSCISAQKHSPSRIRSLALGCLQTLAKSDAKALHTSWIALLGAYNTQDQPSLPHVLLNDPQSRVRHAAAATIVILLEGASQRAYLAIAEAKTVHPPPVRGFITLSLSLGRAVLCTHKALLKCIMEESDILVVAAALRALATLLAGCLHERLPPEFLTSSFTTVAMRLKMYRLGVRLDPVVVAALSCLTILAESTSPDIESAMNKEITDIILEYAHTDRPSIAVEALLALRSLAQHHRCILGNEGYWEQIVNLAVTSSSQQADDKVQQQSIRLVGEFLADDEGIQRWEEAISRIILPHQNSAATWMALSCMKQELFTELSLPHQQQLMRSCLNAVVCSDSALQGASLKALTNTLSTSAVTAENMRVLSASLVSLASGWTSTSLAVKCQVSTAIGAIARNPLLSDDDGTLVSNLVDAVCHLALSKGSDKLKASALQALSQLCGCRVSPSAGYHQAVTTVKDNLGIGSGKTQWAACDCAGSLLEKGVPEAASLGIELATLVSTCMNNRTKYLAAVALQKGSDYGIALEEIVICVQTALDEDHVAELTHVARLEIEKTLLHVQGLVSSP